MTNKLSYVHKGCTGKVRFLDSSDILFHFLRSGLPYTAQFYIIATRVGLDSSCMDCMTVYLKKFIDLCDQTTGNKERLSSI